MAEMHRFGSESPDKKNRPHTVAVGAGGAGRNILSSLRDDPKLTNVNMFEIGSSERLPDLPFVEVSKTDLENSFHMDLPIGMRPTTSSEDKVLRRLSDTEILYVVSGLGGEMGSWTSPVCAQIGKKINAFTIILSATPFKNENEARIKYSEDAKRKIKKYADVFAVFSNDKLMEINPNLPMTKAFDVMNSIIRMPLEDFNMVMTKEDIHHLKKFCSDVDEFRIGAGYGKGRERGIRAAKEAYRSPWLDTPSSYRTILAVVTSGKGRGEIEAQDALEVINKRSPTADILWGLRKEPDIGERTKVTILAGE